MPKLVKKTRGWYSLETGIAGEAVGVIYSKAHKGWMLVHPRLPSNERCQTFEAAKRRAREFIANGFRP